MNDLTTVLVVLAVRRDQLTADLRRAESCAFEESEGTGVIRVRLLEIDHIDALVRRMVAENEAAGVTALTTRCETTPADLDCNIEETS